MPDWRERLEGLRTRWSEASPKARAGVLAALGVVATVAGLFWLRGSDPDMTILYSSLSQQDAAHIVERLRAMNVEYELTDGGATIQVPEASVHETRLTLANEGLPSGGGVGFELFDTQRFGESDFSEQVQFRRALEGELARTIGHLAGVESARVHIVMPERTLFTSEDRGARASVALHLTPGWRLRDDQVSGVTHLVASSVRGLAPEDVTVVDGNGRPLHGAGDGESENANDAQELRARIESTRQRAVQELLDVSLGAGVAVVRVSADIDTAREEHLEEIYDPERSATRSFELREERDGEAEPGAQGVPGAASNLPGGAPAETAENAAPLARRTERRNFEVTKTVHRAVRPIGRLSRLTVAVVVDGTWTGEGDAREFTPRSDEDLARIRALVSTAAGANEARGDVVTVECVPFAAAPVIDDEIVDPWDEYRAYEPHAVAGGIALLLLILLVMWLRARRRRRKAEEAAQVVEGVHELASPEDVPELEANGAAGALPPGAPDFEQLHALALEVARRDPELAARVVRSWLAEDAASAPATEEAA
ncbi:MAG: flagellar basal-body MS-ring/collar protein FliF [Sandaracinaceae bacterium]